MNVSTFFSGSILISILIFRNIFIPFVENFFKNVISKNNKLAMSLILKGYFAGDGHVNYSNKNYG